MADLININMNATEMASALDMYGDFSVGMTATEFVGEVNTAFPDADVSIDDTATAFVAKVNGTGPVDTQQPFVFLHYSDPHLATATTIKADKMMTDPTDSDYDSDIAFALLTGDNQAYNNNGLELAIKAADKGKHLVMMGNHDAAYNSTYSRDNHAAVVRELESYMVNGNVTWGDTKASKTAGYWHRDFPLSSGGKVRLIATDEYEIGGSGFEPTVSQAQADWLIGLLDELGKNDYIILATHKPPFRDGKTPAACRRLNDWCSCHLWSWDSASVMFVFADIINAYATGGSISKTYSGGGVSVTVNKDWTNAADRATFLCFLCGHVHGDFHMPHPTHPDLLVMGVDTCKANVTTPSYDETDLLNDVRDAAGDILLNKVTVDFAKKEIKVERIGAQSVPDITYNDVVYPAVTRDTITFDFNANVKEGGAS